MSDIWTQKQVENNQKRLNSHSDRIKWLEKEQITIAKDSERMEEILIEVKKSLDALNTTVRLLQMQPVDEYKQYKTVIVTAIITAIVAFLMGKLL